MKICLNCGDKLLDQVAKCPTCGNKKDFEIVERNNARRIQEIQSSVPHPKDGLIPKWSTSYAVNPTVSSKDAAKKRIEENQKNVVACCPKCGSTSLSANKKGFGFIRGALGASLGVDAALIAGGIGSGNLVVTCLNCGHKWKR